MSPSHRREALHRSFPKKMEEWDIERIIKDYVDAAERMKAEVKLCVLSGQGITSKNNEGCNRF
jgi:hypothetical protein